MYTNIEQTTTKKSDIDSLTSIVFLAMFFFLVQIYHLLLPPRIYFQVYEMFVAGYQFQVLSPLFTVHWGLQNKKSRPAWRERQNNVNRKYFEIFKREVFARYHKDPLKMLVPKKPKRPGGSAIGR